MSRKNFKAQASSARVAGSGFGASPFGGITAFGRVSVSRLSYVYEPPDLSAISDSSVVIALKNVQKKDSTTKEKALQDLQMYITSGEGKVTQVQDSFLEAWVRRPLHKIASLIVVDQIVIDFLF